MKISYMQTDGNYEDGTPMIEELNELGKFGWDIVSLNINPSANRYRAVMKRETPKERADIVVNPEVMAIVKAEIESAVAVTKKKGTK